MQNRRGPINLIILLSLALGGCASAPGKSDMDNDPSLIQLPKDQGPGAVATESNSILKQWFNISNFR